MGKAVNTASATATKGTSAMMVVKVRLLAVRPRRSSRKRSSKVSPVVFHGKFLSSSKSWRMGIGRYDAIAMQDSAPFAAVPSSAVAATRWVAVGSLLALIVLGLAWELWLAPLRPGGSWLVLKVL